MVVKHGKEVKDYSIVRDMIEKYPLSVMSPDQSGRTLIHEAIATEDLEVRAGRTG